MGASYSAMKLTDEQIKSSSAQNMASDENLNINNNLFVSVHSQYYKPEKVD